MKMFGQEKVREAAENTSQLRAEPKQTDASIPPPSAYTPKPTDGLMIQPIPCPTISRSSLFLSHCTSRLSISTALSPVQATDQLPAVSSHWSPGFSSCPLFRPVSTQQPEGSLKKKPDQVPAPLKIHQRLSIRSGIKSEFLPMASEPCMVGLGTSTPATAPVRSLIAAGLVPPHSIEVAASLPRKALPSHSPCRFLHVAHSLSLTSLLK